jgi:hypothetical protein
MGSRKGMSGATWFTENASENMKHSSPTLKMGWDTDAANRGTEAGAQAAAQRSKISKENNDKMNSSIPGPGGSPSLKMGWDMDAANRGTAAGQDAATKRSISSAENTTKALSNTKNRGSAQSIVEDSEAGGPGDTKETSAIGSGVKSKKMGKTRREGERILNDDNLSTEQKQTEALKQRKKYDKATAQNVARDAKDEERGLRRADKRNKKIDKSAKRNNISVEEATKNYDSRRNSVNSFTSKGSGGARGSNPADSSKKSQEANTEKLENQGATDLDEKINPKNSYEDNFNTSFQGM